MGWGWVVWGGSGVGVGWVSESVGGRGLSLAGEQQEIRMNVSCLFVAGMRTWWRFQFMSEAR